MLGIQRKKEIMIVPLVIWISIAVINAQCPPEENISPLCSCLNMVQDSYMTCSNVLNAEDLISPITAVSSGHNDIFSLQINNSSLLYIPHQLFKGTKFQKIRFFQTEIMSLSDSDVAFEGLEDTLTEIRATDAHYIAQWDWQQLRHLQKLDLIDVNWIALGDVSEPFPELKRLTALGITKSEIDHVVDFAFANLTNLVILNLRDNHISELKRNMFPSPANQLLIIDLSHNDLMELPNDFFTEMPALKQIQLHNNKFYTLSEEVFTWPLENLHVITFGGNKVRCDCRLKWIVGQTIPYDFNGVCAEPESLAGRKLSTLMHKELWC